MAENLAIPLYHSSYDPPPPYQNPPNYYSAVSASAPPVDSCENAGKSGSSNSLTIDLEQGFCPTRTNDRRDSQSALSYSSSEDSSSETLCRFKTCVRFLFNQEVLHS